MKVQQLPFSIMILGLSMVSLAAEAKSVAYIANGTGNPSDPATRGVFVCDLDDSGQLSRCRGTDYKTIIDSVTSYNVWDQYFFLYIADEKQGVSLCSINTFDAKHQGDISNCVATPDTNVPNWQPSSIAFPVQSDKDVQYYGFVTDLNQHIYQCAIPYIDMKMTTCTNAISSNEPENWNPVKVVFKTVGDTQYAYVAGSSIYQCSLNKDYSFHDCKAAVADKTPAWTPTDVTFATVHGKNIVYVSSFSNLSFGKPGLYRCNVMSDGSFQACASVTGYPDKNTGSREIAIYQTKGKQIAFVASGTDLYSCTINPDGNFSACAVVPAAGNPGWSAWGIDIRNFDAKSKKPHK